MRPFSDWCSLIPYSSGIGLHDRKLFRVLNMPQKIPSSEHLQIESLRLTAFLRGEPEDRLSWWGKVFGGEPDARNLKPSLHQTQETGTVGEYFVVLASQLNRVDMVLQAKQQEDEPVAKWIGAVDAVMTSFNEMVTRWLRDDHLVTRLAFGLTVHLPMPGKVEAYSELAKYLTSVKLDAENSSDFAYQINRPRSSSVVGGLIVNRLSKWSAAFFTPVRFSMEHPQRPQATTIGEGRYSCRFEVDVNSSADWTETLPNSQIVRLFAELRDMALEIADCGDIA